MYSDQKAARIFGGLFLLTFLTSIAGALLYSPVLDLDHLKRFNDAHGQPGGDRFQRPTHAAAVEGSSRQRGGPHGRDARPGVSSVAAAAGRMLSPVLSCQPSATGAGGVLKPLMSA